MKNKSVLNSIVCAVKGLFSAIKTEKNFIFYFLNILITLPINFLMHFSATEHLIYTICVVGVFSAECLNTAIERICDSFINTYDEKVKTIKDISAGAVLCWGISFYIAEAVMLGGKFLA